MSKANSEIITEITPLSDKDCFYIVDRYKDRFNYPIHRHDEYELNFVSGCAGACRIVGDSVKEIGDYDLVLVGGGIEHAWEQHNCKSEQIREITIQFSSNIFGEAFLSKNQMSAIRDMLDRSRLGLAFSQHCIMHVFHRLERLVTMQGDFYRFIELLTVLHELATCDKYTTLATAPFAKMAIGTDSRRVSKVQSYIIDNYRNEITLSQLADLADMTPTAFSRFFKLRTGKLVSDYIIDVRLGFATRALIDSTNSISEICYSCGFNNVSYFNRIFKKKKGCSPKEFREYYKHHRVLI